MTEQTNTEVQNETVNAEANTEATAKPAKAKRKRAEMPDFITAWETVANGEEPSVAKVAKLLDCAEGTVSQRATKYRTKHGIALTKMPRGGGAKLDVAAAQAVLANLRTQREEAQTQADAEGEKTEEKQEA